MFVEVTNDVPPGVAWKCPKHGLAMHMDKPAGQMFAQYEALASCRVMGNAMATGVGAGAAAAQAVKEGIDVRAVDARKLNLFK